MMKTILFVSMMCIFTSCVICTAPTSVSWRSNTSQQIASTDGRNDKEADSNQVNADKSSELKSAVSTSSGTANAAGEKNNKTSAENNPKDTPSVTTTTTETK